jgi:hypothetical protein
MFGDVNRSAAVFAAQRKALQDANQKQGNGSRPSRSLIGWQQANEGSRSAHNAQRDEERILAAYQVANPPEEERAEWPDNEADGEGGEIGDEGQRVISGRVELGER